MDHAPGPPPARKIPVTNAGLRRRMHSRPIDHAQLCRLPDGSRFIISQPYCEDELCQTCLENIAAWKDEIPALEWKSAGKERSWYFPGSAVLLVLGDQSAISQLDLDYPVPEETKPTGCKRYKTTR